MLASLMPDFSILNIIFPHSYSPLRPPATHSRCSSPTTTSPSPSTVQSASEFVGNMRILLRGKRILNWIPTSNGFKRYQDQTFCSSTNKKKPVTINNSSSSNGSLSNYSEQYKALDNLDFMKAAKILFSDSPNKKKFGLDFHLVQLFFVCLPSLAVYLVAQYARSEMRKMDAELERKRQAEFEAQAKEMELKAAEEKKAAASNPELLEVKDRLNKLEEAVKGIVVESKKQLGDAIKTGREDKTEQKQATQASENNQNKNIKGGTFQDSRK